MIKAQYPGSHLADICTRMNDYALDGKMISPMICARIVEPREFTRARRNRADVCSLGTIEKCAGITQILGSCCPTMLLGDHVIDLTTKIGILDMD